ncbi:uncharacterized protein ACA1_015490 [Acanthamoeba castellanii str. Neff]|uniref:Uncharacterized protein n=1 Tax=Acanthamoeba castellanii (strain ATCC 30010 / Neff) TaxID=1257118 RepID=L8H0I8_ACACF|nr:uncharacterized protein ACA1_015490 [Acanthamoeba castellanii str. Neff]ELR18727.1 hypothetical protein ACA1_015490 [Acanthamoeba castellanii str. Neff]
MDHEAQSVVIEATNMLLLSKYIEPQAEALHTLSRLSRFDSWRSIIAERGCLYNMLLGINGRLSDSSRKWALKSLVHFADDRNYRLRVGEGGLSSIIKTTINNPYDEVKAPAVTILAILASNDSYRNRILGTKVLDKIVGYLQSHNEKLRTQSAHLLVHLAATDESRKRAADLNAVEAVVTLFDRAPTENARLYSVAAMGQLALTASVRRRLGDSGAVDAIGRYLENTATSSSATRAHCFAALVQLSFDDELKAKMKNGTLLGVLLSSSESSDLEEQMWALRALLHLSLDGDGKAKLQQLRCGNVMEQIRRRTQKAEVKLLAEEVLASLKAAAT